LVIDASTNSFRAPVAEDQAVGIAEPGEPRQPFHFHGQDQEQQDLEFRVEIGEGEEDRSVM